MTLVIGRTLHQDQLMFPMGLVHWCWRLVRISLSVSGALRIHACVE